MIWIDYDNSNVLLKRFICELILFANIGGNFCLIVHWKDRISKPLRVSKSHNTTKFPWQNLTWSKSGYLQIKFPAVKFLRLNYSELPLCDSFFEQVGNLSNDSAWLLTSSLTHLLIKFQWEAKDSSQLGWHCSYLY